MSLEYLKHLLVRTPLERPARWIQRVFQGAGPAELDLVNSEPRLIDAFLVRSLREDSNCIDVGCHLGAMLSQFVRLAPRGSHVAFEPIPSKAAWLRKKFPEVQVIEAAASDVDGSVDFFVNRRRSGFSGLRRHAIGSEGFETIRVDQRRLDGVVKGSTRVDLLKIDVEGGELGVLKGALHLIRKHRPVLLFECTRSGLQAHGLRADDVYSFLVSRCDYEIFVLCDFLGGGTALGQDEFDAAQEYPFRAFNFVARSRNAARDLGAIADADPLSESIRTT